MICNKCNRQLPDDSEFCQYCGSKLDQINDTLETQSSFDELNNEEQHRKNDDSSNEFTQPHQTNEVLSCYSCGAICAHSASFCSECGASLSIKPLQNNKKHHVHHSKVLVIINFAFNVCLTLYACFAFLAVALLRIVVNVSHKVSLKYSSWLKEYYISNSGPSTSSYVRLDETFVVLATIMAVAILALAIISFILELKKEKSGDEKLFLSILRLVIGAVVTTTTIFLLCCNNFVI